MCHKFKTFDKFKEYKEKMDNHRGKSIKSLRSDRGGEYIFSEFRQNLKDRDHIPNVYTRSATAERGGREEESNLLRYGKNNDELRESS